MLSIYIYVCLYKGAINESIYMYLCTMKESPPRVAGWGGEVS
jgi:hypothetical protein